jgi:hypothetical protein
MQKRRNSETVTNLKKFIYFCALKDLPNNLLKYCTTASNHSVYKSWHS